MSAPHRPAAVCVEIMKASRQRWLSAREVAEHADVDIDTARRWVCEMEEQGLLKSRQGAPRSTGPAPQEFKLSTAWGGL